MNLAGKKGLVIGVANHDSIAAGCAKAFSDNGASLALTYYNDKALPYVQTVSDSVGAELLLPLNVDHDDQLDAVFTAVKDQWGKLDFLLHSIAYCPKEDLHAQVVDASRDGFLQAMDTSCHSFIRMAKRAVPLMEAGGCLLTVSYYGAEKVVDNYNIMGPVKAALEASVRYLAADLGPHGIRVNALSPGPMRTRAASGIAHFDDLINEAVSRSPERTLVTLEDVGAYAAFLASDSAKHVTGSLAYIDAGYNIMS